MKRIHPPLPIPADTPERMIAMFKDQMNEASPELKAVLVGLVEKWSGWHGTTFRFLDSGGWGGVKVQNWDDLYRECVMV